MTKRKESEHCPDSRTGKSPRHWIPETKSCRSVIRQWEYWLTCSKKNIIYALKRMNLFLKQLKKENNSTNTQPSSTWKNWREHRSHMGLNRTNKQSRRVLSLRLRVRDGMSEHVPSQRKEPLTSRRMSRHGMSCKSVSRHTVVSASFIH